MCGVAGFSFGSTLDLVGWVVMDIWAVSGLGWAQAFGSAVRFQSFWMPLNKRPAYPGCSRAMITRALLSILW